MDKSSEKLQLRKNSFEELGKFSETPPSRTTII